MTDRSFSKDFKPKTMKSLVIIFIFGVCSCSVPELVQSDLSGAVEYTILEKDQAKVYGVLKVNPNQGYRITRTTNETLPSTGEPVNAVVTILSAYSNSDDHFCMVNQMVSEIRIYNRWGEELKPGIEDLDIIRSQYQLPERFSVKMNDKTLTKE